MKQCVALVFLLVAVAVCLLVAAHSMEVARYASDQATIDAGGQLDSECGTGPSFKEELIGYAGWLFALLAAVAAFVIWYWDARLDDDWTTAVKRVRPLSIDNDNGDRGSEADASAQ